MIESIYDTLQALLFQDLPKNNAGQVVVYDRPILNWIFGDRGITPSPLGVIFHGTSIPVKDIAYGIKEYEHNITITLYSSSDDGQISERVIDEFSRLVQAVLLQHRVIWVIAECPFCNKIPLTPLHYINQGMVTSVEVIRPGSGYNSTPQLIFSEPTSDTGLSITYTAAGIGYTRHGSVYDVVLTSPGVGYTQPPLVRAAPNFSASLVAIISDPTQGHLQYLNSYVNEVYSEFVTNWSVYNTTTPPTPSLAGLAAEAMQRLIYDVQYGIAQTMLPPNVIANINNGINDYLNNIRLLYDVNISNITPSDDGVNKELLHNAKFTLNCKEQVRQTIFGPNNVSVNAY